MAEIVQIAGVAVGSLFGPVGAAIGGAIGGAVGQELFPGPPIRGPRIEELRVSGSTVGSIIAQVYGEQRLGGQVIWMDEIREDSNKKSSGGLFGVGGQTTVTYSYFADFAVGFAEGEIGAVRKIWFDNKLVYDASVDAAAAAQQALDNFDPSDPEGAAELVAAAVQRAELQRAVNEAFAVKFQFYSGAEGQMPDPTIEAAVGIGKTSAYRGLCYIVFKNIDITDGRRIPNVNVELIKKPEAEETVFDSYMPRIVYPWVEGGADPRNPLNGHQYRYDTAPWRTTLEEALADLNADILSEEGPGKSVLPNFVGWSTHVNPQTMFPFSADLPIAAGETRLTLHFGRFPTYRAYSDLDEFASTTCTQIGFMDPVPEDFEVFLWVDAPVTIIQSPWWVYISPGGASPEGLEDFSAILNCAADWSGAGIDNFIYRIQTSRISVERLPKCPESDCDDETVPLSEAPGYCLKPDGTVLTDNPYTLVTGDFLQLQAFGGGL